MRIKPLIGAVLISMAIVMVQILYWKYTSGKWIVFTYGGDDYFEFNKSMIGAGLFGYKKGWFIWTPIAFVSMFGFLVMINKIKRLVFPLMFFLSVMVYVVFSWHIYWYGGGFGCRPLIDILPIIALPLGYLLEYFLNKKQMLYKVFMTIVLLFCISLNIFQSYQFHLGVFNWGITNKEYYWRVFGKTSVTPDDLKVNKLD